MIDFGTADLAALVSAGMAVSFLLADPRTPTSRALSVALLAAAASIYLNTTFIKGVPPGELPWFAGFLALAEVVGFIAVYQWMLYLRETIPAENLRTTFGDNMLRVAQFLVLVYGVECLVWPDLRAEYFQNALGAPGGGKAYQFYLFAIPLELSMLLATLSAVLLLNRRPDLAERRRLIAVCLATPMMSAGLILPDGLAALVTVLGEMVLLIGAIQYHVSQGQRNQFLGRFLSPQVESLVRRQGLARAMKQDTREIAVICCDIRGFTTLSGKLHSSETLQMLSEFYAAIGDVTTEFGATIKDYAGDGVLILLGAPIRVEDATAQAARLAARLHVAVAPVLARWERDEAPLGFGVGVSSGPVTVGVIGGARLEYVAVGQTVNLAARLCDCAEPGETLIDDATARVVSEELPVHAREPLDIKGFAEPVSHYALAV